MIDPSQVDLLGGHDTLQEARQKVREGWLEGIACLCCGQVVKLYRRSIGKSQARFLIWLVRSCEREQRYYDCKDAPLRGGDYAKLRFWGLIEKEPASEHDNLPSGYSGMWRPTPQGVEFANNRTRVQKYALVFDNKLFGFEGEYTCIEDCLPKYFDFWETWGFDL